MALRWSIKYILFRIGKYYHSMMPLFRQERCAPWAPIWCHADFISRERPQHLAQHDIVIYATAPQTQTRCHIKTVEKSSSSPRAASVWCFDKLIIVCIRYVRYIKKLKCQCPVSGVRCLVSNVRCPVSGVWCHYWGPMYECWAQPYIRSYIGFRLCNHI
jgi:hypothetical protein